MGRPNDLFRARSEMMETGQGRHKPGVEKSVDAANTSVRATFRTRPRVATSATKRTGAGSA